MVLKYSKRVTAYLPIKLHNKFQEYRFKERFSSESDALITLIEAGLEKLSEKAEKRKGSEITKSYNKMIFNALDDLEKAGLLGKVEITKIDNYRLKKGLSDTNEALKELIDLGLLSLKKKDRNKES